ncbi:hypothetical protein H5410_027319 [Solanum commersonii]|uniref:DUF4283 domain-containing protein n=1 Tax=Solanum commersonii TaxID=4109 RepID=A0A9J5YYS1_SOLCO|nr:hypothetical protein H5410_027319 [Solanum commersonii]
MPKVDLIRNNFIIQTQLSGGVKIAHFNSRQVYIDLDNELEYNMVWTKQRMSIAGQVMRIQVWTPNFKPAEENPIVLIWISLHELPWHCYNKEFVSSLLSPIGKVLYLDFASIKKTRGSQARVKVQVDLTQQTPPYIWIGYIGEDITDGRWQKIEYDNIPDYYFYCNNKGKEIFKGPAVTGFGSMLPFPKPIDNVVNIIAGEAIGDQNLLDTSQHVDEQGPDIINKGKLTLDDYGDINSDDEMDPDNQSIDESDEDIEDTM